jgi:PelA/Pel-15E family pectate lyase
MKCYLLSLICATIVPVAISIAENAPAPAKLPDAKPKPPVAVPTPKPLAPPPSPFPDPAEVTRVMKKAANFFRHQVSFLGGYAWKWPQDMSIAHGEDHSSPTLIMIEPPGTPAVGHAMLNAYNATGDKLFLQGAKEAAQALMWCQLASGGWDSDFDFDPRKASHYHFRRDLEAGDTELGPRHADSTLDDDKTQSALTFLLELAHTEACKDDVPLQAALKFGLDGLLAAQAPNGGWGQHYSGPADPNAPITKAKLPTEWPHIWPNVDYTRFYTLNDHNLRQVMLLLLRAFELEKDKRFLTAALKLGDFLLLAQFPEPQPAWAQQYDRDMVPVWARRFEPPAVCTIESLGVIEALTALWVATGDKKYVQTAPAAIAWLERSKLPDGHWARFYECVTNRPLYCKAQTYEVTFDDSDTPTHYRFKTDPEFGNSIASVKATLAMSRDKLLQQKVPMTEPRKWASRAKSLAPKASVALKAADKKGAWLKNDLIDAEEFVKNFKAMTSYVEAAKKGGAEFEEMRKKPLKPQ